MNSVRTTNDGPILQDATFKAKECTKEYAYGKVSEMYGRVTAQDIPMYQNAYNSVQGDTVTTPIVFNQMRQLASASAVETKVYREIICLLAGNKQTTQDQSLSNMVSELVSRANADEHKEPSVPDAGTQPEACDVPALANPHEYRPPTEPEQPKENASPQDPSDNVPLPMAHYKKQKIIKLPEQETVINSTYPWISEHCLEEGCYKSFIGIMSANMHVSARRVTARGSLFFSQKGVEARRWFMVTFIRMSLKHKNARECKI